MVKRNHPLQFGEKVYDCDTQSNYHVTAINADGTIGLAMTDADIRENYLMFDCEIPADEYERTTNNPDALYQYVPGLVARDGNPICYEHNTEIGWNIEDERADGEPHYPYFSPYLFENLFAFETFTPEEYAAR